MTPRTPDPAAGPQRARTLLAGLLLSLPAGAALAQTTSKEVFTPGQGDLALRSLSDLAGCTVDALWRGGACDDASRPLTAALAWLNIACLIVAALLACWLLYATLADTANDGEVFSRRHKGTLARLAAGAVLALPVKSGLSLLQILVLQLAVFGSGAADTLWGKVAATSLNGMYGALPAIEAKPGDYVMRARLAEALRIRLYGYVCKAALEDYSKNLSGAVRAITPETRKAQGSSGLFGANGSTTYTFKDATGYFGHSDSLCGAVSWSFAALDPKLTGKDAVHAAKLMGLAGAIGQQAIAQALTALDAAARSIAHDILTGKRDETAVKAAIAKALDSAAAALGKAIAALAQSRSPDMRGLLDSYLEDATHEGWLTAILWQRSMTAIHARLQAAVQAAEFRNTEPAALTSYIPSLARLHGAGTALSDKAARDIAYVKGFEGYFAELSQPMPLNLASDTAAKQTDAAGVTARAIAWIYQSLLDMLSRPQTSTWRDPILQAQETGTAIAYWGGGLTATGAAGSALGGFVPVAGEAVKSAGSFVSTIGIALMALAFLLAGVVPFVVLINFGWAVFNWLLTVLEAMVAAPIWLLTLFMPASGGRSATGWLFLLGLLLRPPLILIAFLACLLAMRVFFNITDWLFRGALGIMAPDGTMQTLLLGSAGIICYGGTLFAIVWFCAGQISALPERALGYLGGFIERHAGAQAAHHHLALALPVNPAVPARSLANAGATMLQNLRGQKRLPPP